MAKNGKKATKKAAKKTTKKAVKKAVKKATKTAAPRAKKATKKATKKAITTNVKKDAPIRCTKMQIRLLKGMSTGERLTPAQIARSFNTYPGPVMRSIHTLVEHGYVSAKTTKDGVSTYARTGAGAKLAHKL